MTSKKIVCCFYLSILKKSKTNIKITLKKQLVNYDAQGPRGHNARTTFMCKPHIVDT